MNYRQKRILNYLLTNSDYITYQELAELFEVSSRTVRNDFKHLSTYFEEKKLVLDAKPNRGIRVVGSESEKQFLVNRIDLKKEKIDTFSAKYRRMKILNDLLHEEQYLSINKLAEKYYISPNSIALDFINIEQWLQRYHLMLSKSNKGTSIMGSEKNIRSALSALADEFLEMEMEESVGYDSLVRLDLSTVYRLKNMFGIDQISEIELLVRDAEKQLGYQISESSYVAFVTHILIMIKRRMLDETLNAADLLLTNEPCIKSIKEITYQLSDGLEESFSVSIPEVEREYLYQYLISASVQREDLALFDTHYDFVGSYDKLYFEIAQEIMTKMSTVTSIELTKDYDLKLSLVAHLHPMLERLKYGIRLKNPLLSAIRGQYEAVFSLLMITMNQMSDVNLQNLPDDEIGYLTIHFQAAIERNIKQHKVVIVCPEGVGFSKLVEHRIKKFIPSLIVEKVIPLANLSDFDLKGIDFILSTVKIENLDVPVIHVSAFIDEEDIKKINASLIYLNANIEYSRKYNDLTHLIEKECVHYVDTKMTKDEVLQLMCYQLHDRGYVKSEFYDSVLHRETVTSTLVGNGIGIPHGKSDLVDKTCICILVSKQPIGWGNGDVNVVFLIAFNTQDQSENIKKAMHALYNLIDSKEDIESLKHVQNIDEIFKVMGI